MKSTTHPTPRPLNATDSQSRHLLEFGRLLLVLPLKEQPPEGVGTIRCGGYHPTVVRRSGSEEPGRARFGAYNEDGDWSIEAPYKPGDVVPLREPYAQAIVVKPNNGWQRVLEWVYKADYRGTERLVWAPAKQMREETIRLRPTVVMVECRRVSGITGDEAEAAAFKYETTSRGEIVVSRAGVDTAVRAFAADWPRRHKRPADAFDCCWGFFYTLSLKGK